METNVKEFRKGIFALNTRRFGTVTELMIKRKYGYKKSKTLAYDLKDEDKRIEVKFSTVLKRCDQAITEDNLIEQVIASNSENRMLTFDAAKKDNFDCNIQQVKPKEFDILYYGCFFKDKIMICKIDNKTIFEDEKINYSSHQHRGNSGEGQFHINNTTIENHLNKYLVDWITYEELFEMFNKKDEA